MKYKNFLEAQMQEKTQERLKKKELFSSQAESNVRKFEDYKEFMRQEAQKKREDQLKYRDFLNYQVDKNRKIK